MTAFSVMAEPPPIEQREPGAPIARSEVDPDLIKLARSRPRVGVITAAGVVFLCLLFLVRLNPDRRFAGAASEPAAATPADVIAGKLATDQLVSLAAEPLVSHAIRATNAKGSLGMRVVPVRGTGERVWIAAAGDGWEAPALDGYVGRLRKLDDLPFADATRAWAIAHPRPGFATVAQLRAGATAGAVTTVDGDTVTLADATAVAADTIDPGAVTIAASFNDRLPDVAAWRAALDKAGLTGATAAAPDTALGQIRFSVPDGVTTATTKLEAAGLWAARVEPVTRHYETTWAALQPSLAAPGPGLALGATTVPDAQLDVLGLYVARPIPADAYVVVTGELPDDYWYVMPITIAIAAILLLFTWALIRAVRRDLLPQRA